MVMSTSHETRKATTCHNNALIARGHDTEQLEMWWNPQFLSIPIRQRKYLHLKLNFSWNYTLTQGSFALRPSQQLLFVLILVSKHGFIQCRTYEGTAAAAKEKNHPPPHSRPKSFLWNEFIWNLWTHELPESSTHHHTTGMHSWKFYAQRFKCNLAVIKFA